MAERRVRRMLLWFVALALAACLGALAGKRSLQPAS